MTAKNSVCVAVCTCQRPQMLEECLRSLAQLVPIEGIRTEVAVIDNESEPNNRNIVCRFPGFLYIHEPHRGISNARNAALQAAFFSTADWLAFIDDDEIADPRWISRLLSKAAECKADVVGGLVRLRYPKDFPPHLGRREWRTAPDSPTGTGNVLISMRFLRELKTKPSFDPKLTSGEDEAFFTLLRENGAVFGRAHDAIVTETAVVSRYGLWGCIKRGYNGGKRRARKQGKSVAFASTLRLLVGPLKIVLSPLALLGGIRAFTTVCHAGFRTTASGAGAIAGLCGAEPVFYRDIDGY